jgi:lysine 2,3-aminomutase
MTMETARHTYAYARIELVEPDWRRLPGFRDVTAEQWRDVRWQRAHCVRDVRNQGVILNGVNATPEDLLDLCFALHGEAGILPYYFYLCDIVPHVEHWRIPVHEAVRMQEAMMGLLPGYATPRIVCDVPHVGKRWVHQYTAYDREHGISYWDGRHPYYDPISSLPAAGRAWWDAQAEEDTHVQA